MMVLSLSRVPLRARIRIAVIGLALFASVAWVTTRIAGAPAGQRRFDDVIGDHAAKMLEDGRQTFRFDTFGDEAFWGDALQLHRAIAGERNSGVGPGVSSKTALAVGLKVDVDALPEALVQQLREGKVNLDDPAITLALLKLNAVVGVTGFFDTRSMATSQFAAMGVSYDFGTARFTHWPRTSVDSSAG